MADPLSISGTAIGILSLGITVCGAFFDYYDSWKSYGADIARTAASIQHLSQIFFQINHFLEEGKLSDAQKKCIEESLLSCQESLSKLEKKLKKIERQPLPTNIVEYLKNAKRRLLYPFLESTLMRIREHVSDAESVLDTAMSALQLEIVIDGMSRLDSFTNKFSSVLSRLESVSNANSALQSDIQTRQILNWLNPPDILSIHRRHCAARLSGTGGWIFKNEAYIAWSGGAERNLWLHGIPGCGKSVLASNVIDVLNSGIAETASAALLFFYFDFEDPSRKTGESLLRSMVGQLCMQSSNVAESLQACYLASDEGSQKPDVQSLYSCFYSMCQAYEKIYVVIDALDECSARENLFSVLQSLSNPRTENLYMLLTSRRERDIEEFSHDVSLRDISFQAEDANQDIEKYVQNVMIEDKRLKGWPENVRKEVEGALVKQANGMFQWVICQIAALRKCLSVDKLRKSLDTLPKDLNSTYERILRNLDEDYGREVLTILRWILWSERPLLLEETAEILTINARTDPAYDPDRRLRDPDSVIDICSSLVTVVTKADAWDEKTVRRPRKEVCLSHFSVQTYLLSASASAVLRYPLGTQGHLLLAEACISYLLTLVECDTWQPETTKDFPLINYAAQYWYRHARKVDAQDDFDVLDSLVPKLFGSSSMLLRWNQLYDIEEDSSQSRLHMEITDLASPLYYISCAGLTRYVRQFCSGEPHEESTGHPKGIYGSPLIAAAYKGFQDVVEILLAHEKVTKTIRGTLGTALQAAAANGNESMVSLLLKHGEDVNVRAGKYGSALQASVLLGHINVMRCLLNAGADVNIEGGPYGSALAAAAYIGQLEAVALLLNAGADIRRIKNRHRQYFCSPDFNPWTPSLHAGRLVLHVDDPLFMSCYHLASDSVSHSRRSDVDIVRMILQKLPAVRKDQQYLADMLFVATLGGNNAIIEVLLQEQSLVSAPREALQNALLGAFRSGNPGAVDILRRRGATLDWDQPGYKFQLLQAAAVSHCPDLLHILLASIPVFSYKHVYMAFCFALEAESDEAILGPLLSRGLAFESRVWEQILISACRSLKSNTLEFVLQNTQIDVNTELDRKGSALSNEARDGMIQNLPIWLRHGANINLESGRYGCALHAAIARGNVDGVRILLDAGADVNMTAIEGPALVSALQYRDLNSFGEYMVPSASDREFITEAVQLILTHHPDVNKAGRSEVSPFGLAVSRGLTHLAHQLLAAGANRNHLDRFRRDPAFWAALRGDGRLVKELLDSTTIDARLPDLMRAAMQSGAGEMVDDLIDLISDFSATDSSSNGYLFQALYYDRVEAAAKLRAKGAPEPQSEVSTELINFMPINAAPYSTVSTDGHGLRVKDNRWHADLSWRSDVAIARLKGLSYFEVKVLEKEEGHIMIGLCDDNFLLHHRIGMISGMGVTSYGHLEVAETGLQGRFSVRICALWGKGDVVGCGFDYSNGAFLFTLNGALSKVDIVELKATLYFAISTTAENLDLQVISDAESFVFDVEEYQRGGSAQLDWRNIDWKEVDGEPEEGAHQTELEILFDLCSSA